MAVSAAGAVMAYDAAICALTVFCEASSEPVEARNAIAFSIFNRLHDPKQRWGKTIAQVCLQRMQYSEWNDDRADHANLLRGAGTPDSDPIMASCLSAYWLAQSGSPDTTDGATHFVANTIPTPAWAEKATKTVQFGRVIFYKDVP
jgi:spore germination cell wall hydrolase CwlJ-like protein